LNANVGTRGVQNDVYTELTSAKGRLTALEGAGAGGLGFITDAKITADGTAFTTAETVAIAASFAAVAGKRYRVSASVSLVAVNVSTMTWRLRWVAGASMPTPASATQFFSRLKRVESANAFLEVNFDCITFTDLPGATVTVALTGSNGDGVSTQIRANTTTNIGTISVERVS
jgi:hypothetical protein